MFSFCRSALVALFLLLIAAQDCISAESAGMQQTTNAAWRADKPIKILSGKEPDATEVVISEPGASFIKVHFRDFIIPAGLTVEVSNEAGTERYKYSAARKASNRTLNTYQGDDGERSFSAMSISGDTAVIRILGNRSKINALKHRVLVDYYMVGYPEGNSNVISRSKVASKESPDSRLMDQCGSNDRQDAVCYESSNPDEYYGSMPVAKILVNGNRYCTAWRVGPGNHLFTNQHCIRSEAEVASTEVWFDYERLVCGQADVRAMVKVTGNQWLASDPTLDYTLFSVNDFDQISAYGHFGLEVGDVAVGDTIYIPQHGGGLPKQLAIDSDMNMSGQCEIDDIAHPGLDYYFESDIGYYCDTRDGSSGSPVVLKGSNKVVALHHLGGCMNTGAKISLIWPQVSEHFGGIVPGGDGLDPQPNQNPNAAFDFACSELACDFDGTASTDADGHIASFSWDFGDGSASTGALVSHTFSLAGSYMVGLTIEDNEGAQSSWQTAVTVDRANVPPSAAFSVDCSGTSCSFDASLSADSDGQVVDYEWDFGDGSGARGAYPVIGHEFAAEGNYLVSLKIKDDQGSSATAQSVISVTVPRVNEPPVANFSYNCDELRCGFDASQSMDSDGEIIEYAWDFAGYSVNQGSNPLIQYDFPQSGSYLVILTITDDQGASEQSRAVVTVSLAPANDEPMADFSYRCTDLNCVFDASGSNDPDGYIVAYRWDFGEGESSESGGPTKDHTFGQSGKYRVTLQIEDNLGAIATHSAVVSASVIVPPDANTIGFSVKTEKYRGSKRAELSWTGAAGSTVSIFRNGDLLTEVENSGEYTDKSIANKTKSLVYQVCESESVNCSEIIEAIF
jgi:PKD repeat protein